MEALTPASETSRRTEVMALPAALRPTTGAGVPLSTLTAQVGAVPAEGSSVLDMPITGVTLRAQDVQPGDLFAALPGGATHGAGFYGEAVERGAVAVLTDASGLAQLNRDAGVVPVIVHPQPRSVLGELAATVYGHPSERIRVDGADIPSALTTPEAPALQALLAAMAERGVDTVVMEVSSHALTLGRVDGIRFAVGGFTNLSRDHLDFHPTMEDYFEAKARLFDPASPWHARRTVVCVDDDAGRSMAHRADKVTTVSTKGRPADWRAEAVTAEAAEQEFTAVDPAGVHHRLRIALPGDYNIANCLVALAVLDAVGVSPEQASTGLRHTQVPGRLERIDRGQDFLALVDYAHKPGALQEVLRTLRRPTGRLAVVFGAGGDRDSGKRAPMGRVAAELADLVVVTDDNPRSEDPASIRREILSGATEAGTSARVVEIGDRREAIDHAVAWADAGDVVLIAGKGHETGQTRAGHTQPFDDRVELAAALEGRRR